jgi:hypothetical protein
MKNKGAHNLSPFTFLLVQLIVQYNNQQYPMMQHKYEGNISDRQLGKYFDMLQVFLTETSMTELGPVYFLVDGESSEEHDLWPFLDTGEHIIEYYQNIDYKRHMLFKVVHKGLIKEFWCEGQLIETIVLFDDHLFFN